MRVPLSWLRDYVDVELAPEKLAEGLTLLGMEVKGIERWGHEWQNVVVGELLTVARHPRRGRHPPPAAGNPAGRGPVRPVWRRGPGRRREAQSGRRTLVDRPCPRGRRDHGRHGALAGDGRGRARRAHRSPAGGGGGRAGPVYAVRGSLGLGREGGPVAGPRPDAASGGRDGGGQPRG